MKTRRTPRSEKLVALILFAAFIHAVPAAAQKLTQIHIGVPTNTVTWFPLYVAWKKGIFQEQGLELLPVTMSVRASLGALASRHISYITPLGSSMTAIANGLPAKVIMIFAVRSHHVLVAKRDIATPSALRGRGVAISQPGGTVHRQFLKILEHYRVDAKNINMINLGEMPSRALALKAGTIDAAMLSVPYDLFMEKDGFRPLAYMKDVAEFPLLGLIAHDDRMRERPDEVKRVLTAALKGIAYTKSHREEVLPLLKQFVGLPDLEMTRKTFDVIKDLWPDNGIPSDKGLATALTMADVPANIPAERIVYWSFVSSAVLSLKIR
ncbi:MAG TPA: ABC transporter substrate-binding protein [Candidatus Deferrimicrobium sp.]|nr:ABC transporter substrate-binding protein [Candidatus Deferrimicrobium sp.]